MPFLAAAAPIALGAGKMIGDAVNNADDKVGDDPWEQGRQIDRNSFQNPNAEASRAELAARVSGVDARRAPTMTAAQQQAVREYAGAQRNMAPLAQSQGVRLGPVSGIAAAQGQASQVNRQDEQFRARQVALADALQAQSEGRGPSLAEMQLKQATDRNLKQQMAAAASTGGNSALALRNARLGAVATGRQAATDSAMLRTQEQMNARQQLAGVLDSARGQDIGVNTSDANLRQGMDLANMQSRNTVGLANADAANRFALAQGQMDLQNNQFNAGAKNSYNQFSTGLEQQAGLANQAAYNEMLARNTQNQQQANMQNLASQLQTMGYNDEQVRFLLAQKMQIDENERRAQMAYEQLATDQDEALRGRLLTDKRERRAIFNQSYDRFMNAASSAAGGFAPKGNAQPFSEAQGAAPGTDDWNRYGGGK